MAQSQEHLVDVAHGLLVIIDKQSDMSIPKTFRVQAVHRILNYLREVINTEPWTELEDRFLKLFGMLKHYEMMPNEKTFGLIREYLETEMKTFIEGHKEVINVRWNKIHNPHARSRLSAMHTAALYVHAHGKPTMVKYDHETVVPREKHRRSVKYRHVPSVTPILPGASSCTSPLDHPRKRPRS